MCNLMWAPQPTAWREAHSFSAASVHAPEFRPFAPPAAGPALALASVGAGGGAAAAPADPPILSTTGQALGGFGVAAAVGPSQGSLLHDGTGKCSPCAWYWKPKGCSSGEACTYCHTCLEGEIKLRKKAKIAVLRGTTGNGRRVLSC